MLEVEAVGEAVEDVCCQSSEPMRSQRRVPACWMVRMKGESDWMRRASETSAAELTMHKRINVGEGVVVVDGRGEALETCKPSTLSMDQGEERPGCEVLGRGGRGGFV